jgi:two-component system response regulator RpaA
MIADEGLQRRHILVVEDDVDAADALAILLELKGYRVSKALNGLEALERLKSDHSVTLVILDLMMPVMDGMSFLRHIDGDPRLSQVPVIVASATIPSAPIKVKSMVRKPIDFETLAGEIEKVFSSVRIQPSA